MSSSIMIIFSSPKNEGSSFSFSIFVCLSSSSFALRCELYFLHWHRFTLQYLSSVIDSLPINAWNNSRAEQRWTWKLGHVTNLWFSETCTGNAMYCLHGYGGNQKRALWSVLLISYVHWLALYHDALFWIIIRHQEELFVSFFFFFLGELSWSYIYAHIMTC